MQAYCPVVRRLGIRLALSGEYEALKKFLAAVEAAIPPLVIDNLQVRDVLARDTAVGARTRLDTQLEVYGFRKAENSAAPKR